MPIMIRKPSASMTTVGLALMKLASGVAASSITTTATTTAITITGRCGVMPTAVMMLSTENTMSSTRICPITAPNDSRRRAAIEHVRPVIGVDVMMDFRGRLPDQEQSARDQDQVAPRKAVTPYA